MACRKKIKNVFIKPFQPSGFTITEILIVMFIIGVLAALTLPNFNTFNRRQRIKHGVKKLKTDLRTAQNRALAGYKYNDKAAAWGIRLSSGSGSYVRFACGSSENSDDYKYTGSTCSSEGNLFLPDNIEITSISPASPISVIFDVVTGEVYFKNDDGTTEYSGPVLVKVNYIGWDSSEERELTINSGGNVEDVKK